MVTMTVKNHGDITIELYPDKAPNTVCNFVHLARRGFYEGLTFHRIIKGFMIQGGDPMGSGTGGPGYAIKGEFASNRFKKNDLKHMRGAVSMARSMDKDSAGSQFFIVQEDQPGLDGDYAAFGQVTEGMDVVDAVAGVKTDGRDKPRTPVVIEKVTVDTGGEEYGEPEMI